MSSPFRHQAFGRKPEDWTDGYIPEVAGLALTGLSALPVYPAPVFPCDDLPDGLPQYFIAERPNGDRFLVDTQGYNYCRYVARIPKEAR